MDELLERFMDMKGIERGRYPSVNEVEGGRPKLETAAGKAVRVIRDKRDALLSGY